MESSQVLSHIQHLNKWEWLGNKGRCRVLYLGRNSPRYQLESSFAEEDLGVLVNTVLNMSLQCVLETKNWYPGCILPSVVNRSRLPFCSALMRPHSGVLCPVLSSPVQERSEYAGEKESSERLWRWLRVWGAPLLWGEAERTRPVHLGEGSSGISLAS